MKKYLALAALMFAGSVYAAEQAPVAQAPEAAQDEIVVTEKDMQEALKTVQTVMEAAMAAEQAQEEKTETAK